ncbi:hypothetical protein BTEBP_280001 [Brochothrix thermosphacta]|nr:hypothetical protein BTEBP_280001 [Brochothrix thermosphacta]
MKLVRKLDTPAQAIFIKTLKMYPVFHQEIIANNLVMKSS